MILGIDVGGTSTDAVLLNATGISGTAKVTTTTDISTGIVSALGVIRRHHYVGTSLMQHEGGVMHDTTCCAISTLLYALVVLI